MTLGLLSLWVLPGCGMLLPDGSGRIVTEERQVAAFSQLRISNGLKAKVVLGYDRSVKVTSHDNLVGYVQTTVSADRLDVTLPDWLTLADRDTFRIEITNPDVGGLRAEGAAELAVSGLSPRALDVYASGASVITAEGATQTMRMEASGASKLWLRNLAASDVSALASGSSQLELCASGRLNLDLSGASHATYLCHPAPVITNLTGGSTARAE
jgi:hypothetical protein